MEQHKTELQEQVRGSCQMDCLYAVCLSVHKAEISREEIEYLKRKNDVTRMHAVP